MPSAENPRPPRKIYILTSAWHIGDLSVLPEDQVTVFVGPAEAVIDDLAYSAPGSEWVLDWLKTEGDIVRAGEPVAELRSVNGLGTIPLPSPVDGVLAEIRAKRGVVAPRSIVAVIDVGNQVGGDGLTESKAETTQASSARRTLWPPHEMEPY